MSDDVVKAVPARRLAAQRRRAALRRTVRQFASDRGGVVALAVLVVSCAAAALAPVITDPGGLDVTTATGGLLDPPGAGYPLGTDDQVPSVALLTLWERAFRPARRARSPAACPGAGYCRGHRRRPLQGVAGGGARTSWSTGSSVL